MKCEVCDGTGKQSCFECNGSGTDEDGQVCDECSGESEIDCEECYGSGLNAKEKSK